MPNPHKWHFYLHKLSTLSLVLVFGYTKIHLSKQKMQIMLSKFAQLRNNYYLCSRKGCL